MERLKELITQLKEQFDRKAEPAQLLEITRLLEAEIRLMASQPPPPAPARVMPTKIAVMMPSSTKIVAGQSHNNSPEPKKEPAPAPVPPAAVAPVAAIASPSVAASATPNAPSAPISDYQAAAAASVPQPAISFNGASNAPAAVTTTQTATVSAAAVAAIANGTATLKPSEKGQWPFEPFAEKPTDRFTLSQRTREVNDVIGNNASSSLNDKLRSDVVDLKSTLNDSPVRDLKKAIGVNDRYVFINQLFRGDEVMYERSLKTINGFRILPEAEYWMERELKVKLGWDENRETTRHFYQLVKRRFS